MRLQRCRLGVMPDTTVNLDLPEVPADRQAILPMEPHHFVESEFPAGKGHCDLCGGGPLAAIHTHVDPLERLATALEGLAPAFDQWDAEDVDRRLLCIMVGVERIADALERIANILAIGDRP